MKEAMIILGHLIFLLVKQRCTLELLIHVRYLEQS